MFSTVFTKTLHDLRKGLIGWGIGIALTIALEASVWPSFSDIDYQSLLDQYPEALKEAFNITDMGTGAGFLNAELFSLVLPAIFIIYAVGRGARLVAGEEEDGTLEALAALPVPRNRILAEKAGALVAAIGVLSAVLFAAVWVSSVAVGMGIPVLHILNATIAMFLLGVEFGLVSLALSAGTGRRALTIGIASGLAGASYLLYLMGQIVKGFEPYLVLSPFYQAISRGPIGGELPLIVLAMPAAGLVVLAAGMPIFDRRDLAV